jgi:hypothetical protein
MIEALSQQLLNQFAKNLTALIESESEAQPEAPAAQEGAPASQASTEGGAAGSAPGSASTQPGTVSTNGTDAPAAAPRPAPVRRPPAPVVPLDAGSLMRKAMWQSIRNFFARLFGAKQQH